MRRGERSVGGAAIVVALVSGCVVAFVPPAGAAPAWTTVPSPSRLGSSGFTGVSCSSPTFCVAVGSYAASKGSVRTLVERWDGRRWSIVGSPNPSGAADSSLNSVSCTSPTHCFAVGTWYRDPAKAGEPLIERYSTVENVLKWRVVPSPHPSFAADGSLRGVWCTSATNCHAVGSYSPKNTSFRSEALAERWNGTRWAPVASPKSGAVFSGLDGVTCTSARNCFAVGYFYNGGAASGPARILRWGLPGPAWREVNAPGSGSLMSVSCASPTYCVAVGSYSIIGSTLAVIEEYSKVNDVQQWRMVSGNGPPAYVGGLSGVSCSSPTFCIAVGSRGDGGTLLEQWDGSQWSTVTNSPPKQSRLAGVTCTSDTNCFAVGAYTWFNTQRTFVKRYT